MNDLVMYKAESHEILRIEYSNILQLSIVNRSHPFPLRFIIWADVYSQVHKYWDIDTILIFLALYTTTVDLK